MSLTVSIGALGWRPVYSQQLTLDELEKYHPARIAGVHRNGVDVFTESGVARATLPGTLSTADTSVGDWVLIDPTTMRIVRVLERQSLIARLAAGQIQRSQSIAANVDTLFIVTSCNDDFNISRMSVT